MYLIVGLGNPGPRYEGSRHNLGFRVVEFLAGLLKAERPTQRCRSLCASAWISQEQVILAQPLTYMNRSGLAVAQLLRFYALTPDRLILIFDDLDLKPGTIRIRAGGGSAGHRGVQSVIESLQDAGFIRVRIGIGRPPENMEAADYVLEPPSPEERSLLNEAVARAAEAVQVIVRQGLLTAMNLYN
ncbi:MAG TPA: aminoacyl-tRNA hydrolase [Bacillota bacterium]|nr:aminoacyl-tRNA hydrolase [Bacillota bacterium]